MAGGKDDKNQRASATSNKPSAFFYKTLRADSDNFWKDFVYSLIDGAPNELRTGKRQKYTSRLGRDGKYEVIPTNKMNPERKPLWAPEQKASTTRAQSVSYANPQFGRKGYFPSAFGHALRDVLVGVSVPADPASEVMLQLITLYDSGTVHRPKDADTYSEAKDYLDRHLESEVYLESLEDLENIGSKDTDRHNEILARLNWNEENDEYNIMIFEDNLDSRILAQARAWDICLTVEARRKRLGLPTDKKYLPKILFYPSLKPYSEMECKNDVAKALRMNSEDMLALAVRELNKDGEMNKDQKIKFLENEGKNFTRNFNKKVAENLLVHIKSEKNISNEAVFWLTDTLSPDEITEFLEKPESTLQKKYINELFKDPSRFGDMLYYATPENWVRLMGAQSVQDGLKKMLNKEADLSPILLKLHKKHWKKFLSLLPDIRVVDENQKTALEYSIKNEQFEIFEALSDFDETCINYLDFACKFCDDDFVKKMINKNVKVNSSGIIDVTPVASAMKVGNAAVANYLLDNYKLSDINQKLPYDDTIVHITARSDNLEFLKKIVAMGADVNAANDINQSALHIACENNNLEMVTFLLEQKNVSHTEKIKRSGIRLFDSTIYDGYTPFDFAYLNGALSIAEKLIPRGMNILEYLVSLNKELPLYSALLKGHVELAKKLIELGADVNAVDSYEASAIYYMSGISDEELIDTILNKTQNLNMVDSIGATPLLNATSAHGVVNVQLALKLLDRKVNIDSMDVHGNTALYHATYLRSREVTLRLVEEGADLFKKNKAGETPYQNLRFPTVSSTEINSKDARAILMDCLKLRPELISNILNDIASLPLEYQPQFDEIIKLCIENKQKIFQSEYLLVNMPLIKKIIQLGADVNEMDQNKDTLLLRYIKSRDSSCDKTANALIDIGADISIIGSEGLNAMQLAIKYKRYNVILHLLRKSDDLCGDDESSAIEILFQEQGCCSDDDYYDMLVSRMMKTPPSEPENLILKYNPAPFLMDYQRLLKLFTPPSFLDLEKMLSHEKSLQAIQYSLNSYKNIDHFMGILSDELKIVLISKLGISFFEKMNGFSADVFHIKNSVEFANILNAFPSDEWPQFLKLFSNHTLKSCLEDPKNLYTAMSYLKKEDRPLFVKCLSEVMKASYFNRRFYPKDKGFYKLIHDPEFLPEDPLATISKLKNMFKRK